MIHGLQGKSFRFPHVAGWFAFARRLPPLFFSLTPLRSLGRALAALPEGFPRFPTARGLRGGSIKLSRDADTGNPRVSLQGHGARRRAALMRAAPMRWMQGSAGFPVRGRPPGGRGRRADKRLHVGVGCGVADVVDVGVDAVAVDRGRHRRPRALVQVVTVEPCEMAQGDRLHHLRHLREKGVLDTVALRLATKVVHVLLHRAVRVRAQPLGVVRAVARGKELADDVHMGRDGGFRFMLVQELAALARGLADTVLHIAGVAVLDIEYGVGVV